MYDELNKAIAILRDCAEYGYQVTIGQEDARVILERIEELERHFDNTDAFINILRNLVGTQSKYLLKLEELIIKTRKAAGLVND